MLDRSSTRHPACGEPACEFGEPATVHREREAHVLPASIAELLLAHRPHSKAASRATGETARAGGRTAVFTDTDCPVPGDTHASPFDDANRVESDRETMRETVLHPLSPVHRPARAPVGGGARRTAYFAGIGTPVPAPSDRGVHERLLVAHLDAWLAWAARSRLRPFVALAHTLPVMRRRARGDSS